jgi:hypothetical protein
MSRDTTVIAFRQPEAVDDPLSELGPGVEPALRIVTGSNGPATCNENEVLVSVVCSTGSPDGPACPAGSTATGLCVRK